MEMKRKVELAQQSIAFISRHDDADMAVREAALKRIETFIASEREQMGVRVAEKIESSVGAEPVKKG